MATEMDGNVTTNGTVSAGPLAAGMHLIQHRLHNSVASLGTISRS
jgi:hypothetical protein